MSLPAVPPEERSNILTYCVNTLGGIKGVLTELYPHQANLSATIEQLGEYTNKLHEYIHQNKAEVDQSTYDFCIGLIALLGYFSRHASTCLTVTPPDLMVGPTSERLHLGALQKDIVVQIEAFLASQDVQGISGEIAKKIQGV